MLHSHAARMHNASLMMWQCITKMCGWWIDGSILLLKHSDSGSWIGHFWSNLVPKCPSILCFSGNPLQCGKHNWGRTDKIHQLEGKIWPFLWMASVIVDTKQIHSKISHKHTFACAKQANKHTVSCFCSGCLTATLSICWMARALLALLHQLPWVFWFQQVCCFSGKPVIEHSDHSLLCNWSSLFSGPDWRMGRLWFWMKAHESIVNFWVVFWFGFQIWNWKPARIHEPKHLLCSGSCGNSTQNLWIHESDAQSKTRRPNTNVNVWVSCFWVILISNFKCVHAPKSRFPSFQFVTVQMTWVIIQVCLHSTMVVLDTKPNKSFLLSILCHRESHRASMRSWSRAFPVSFKKIPHVNA